MIESATFSLIEKAVDKFPANIAVLDDDGRIIHVNDSWISFAHENGVVDSVPEEGTDYLAVTDADPSESASDAAAGIRQVLGGEMDTFELTYPCHSPDEKRWFTMRVAGFTCENDRYATVVHVDITDRERREQELELFESIFTNQIGMALMFDEFGEVILANERYYDLVERSPEQVVGTHYEDLGALLPAPAEEMTSLEELLSQVLGDELAFGSSEVDLFLAGDAPMTTDVRIRPYEIDAYTNGAILTARDITKWKEREERLRLYESAVEGATEMLSAVGPDYRFLFANEAYKAFHGIDTEELSTVRIEDVLSGEDLGMVREHVDRVLHGERIQYTHEREGPHGKVHPLSVRYYPLRGEDGSIIGAVSAMQDMSERRERERHLLVLDRVLRHNMHNDMNIIQGYAELVRERADGDIAEYGEKIEATATGLLETVDKQRSIIELLSKSPEFLYVDLVDVVERIVASQEVTDSETDLTLEAPPSLELKTISQIEKAVSELVENAVVHMDRPGGVVEVRVLEADGRVKIEVADEGPGIPEEERGVLTGHRDIGPLYHGSGMGLWMVNWIVSRAGGSLQFSSGDPRGSIVTIELPKE